jgi:hypothetical protein
MFKISQNFLSFRRFWGSFSDILMCLNFLHFDAKNF